MKRRGLKWKDFYHPGKWREREKKCCVFKKLKRSCLHRLDRTIQLRLSLNIPTGPWQMRQIKTATEQILLSLLFLLSTLMQQTISFFLCVRLNCCTFWVALVMCCPFPFTLSCATGRGTHRSSRLLTTGSPTTGRYVSVFDWPWSPRLVLAS